MLIKQVEQAQEIVTCAYEEGASETGEYIKHHEGEVEKAKDAVRAMWDVMVVSFEKYNVDEERVAGYKALAGSILMTEEEIKEVVRAMRAEDRTR